MSSYRIDNLAKFKKAKKIALSKKAAAEIEKELFKTRQKYEVLLGKSFAPSYFENFRITIFGSGLLSDEDVEYFNFVKKLTEKLGEEMQVDIVTGGGGGLMLAANCGLEEAKIELKKKHKKILCHNRGIKVNLANEFGRNKKLDVIENFQNFSTRLEEFVRTSNGIYLAPGGFGTDLEASMFVQLKQRWKLEEDFPILAHPFWKPIFEHENQILFDKQIENGRTPFITKSDKKIIFYTKNLNEIVKTFKKSFRGWKKLRKKVEWVK